MAKDRVRLAEYGNIKPKKRGKSALLFYCTVSIISDSILVLERFLIVYNTLKMKPKKFQTSKSALIFVAKPLKIEQIFS